MEISLKDLKSLFCEEKEKVSSTHKSGFIGKVCMFRTYSAGVHFGELVEKDGRECLVKNAKRVFYWSHACSLSQLAIEGSKKVEDCKISMAVPEILLTEVIEIIPMPEAAIKNLSEVVWKK